MSHSSLADFLEELDDVGELARVSVEVDPELEIAEITRRVAAEGGPALLFERVAGRSLAVVTNLLGTEDRICRALKIESLDEIAERTESLIEKNTPHNWFDRLKISADEAGANKFRAKSVKAGPCQQVVRLGRDVDLTTLPAIKQWPLETNPAITGALVISQHSGDETRSATLCPLQVLDANRLAVVDDGHSNLARHWSRALAAHAKLPVVALLGGDPAGIVAANLELDDRVDFFHLLGLLRGKALDLVKCRTHSMEVPAKTDMVLEGYLDPESAPVAVEAAATAGSYYRPRQPAAVLHVTAVTHRSHPIFPAIVDSGPLGEVAELAAARERMLLPAVRTVAPDVVDVHLPAFGGLHGWALVSLSKRYPFHARQIASALWGSAALRFTKFLVLVDSHVDVHDVPAVLAEVGANVAPERDIFSYDGPAHGSDHANPGAALGRHLALDATAKIAGEQTGTWPAPLAPSAEISQLVSDRWAEYKLEMVLEAARAG